MTDRPKTYRLSPTLRQLLVAAHVLFAMAFFGGTLSLLLLRLHLGDADNEDYLVYTLSSMHVIDETLIKYPALAALISGILLSIWTAWGLTRYYWIVSKLVLTIGVILVGIFLVNPWFSFIVSTVDQHGFVAVQRQDFQAASTSLLLGAIANNLALAVMTVVTYLKPFGKIARKR